MAPPSDRDILPDAIKPLNYDLFLFNLEFGGSWSYDGLVKIDSEVKQILSEAHTKARDILLAHRTALEALAKLLLEKEVVDRPALQAMFGGRSGI